jgi:Uma2 family endonuclease
VWIVDLRHHVLEAHRQPGPNGYASVTTHGPADTVSLALAPTISVALRDVLG